MTPAGPVVFVEVCSVALRPRPPVRAGVRVDGRPGNQRQRVAGRRLQALAEERRRLAMIIDGTAAGTWEWNVQTGEMRVNARWAEIVGYRLEELEPVCQKTFLKLVHPDDIVLSDAARGSF